MASRDWLTTQEIRSIFAEEITAVDGSVPDTFDDGTRLFLRSVLPGERAVGERDLVQGGVALRASATEIWIHPYVFRQVCRNGAIIAQAIQTRHLAQDQFEFAEGPDIASALGEAIRACCSEDAFHVAADAIRSSREKEADFALAMMPMIARLPAGVGAEILSMIMGQFRDERDQSRFGLMNAVTAVARETRDPEMRWRLEEFGGGIPFDTGVPAPRPGRPRARVLAEV